MFKDSSYSDRLQELNVLETDRRNRQKFEPHSVVIDFLYMQIQKNANDSKRIMFSETSTPVNDSHCSQEPCNDSRLPNTGTHIRVVTRPSLNTNASINTQARSLKTQQRKAFDVVCEWAIKKVIYINSNEFRNPKPLHLFITGGAGVGKYHLIHALKMFLEKILQVMLDRLKNSRFFY